MNLAKEVHILKSSFVWNHQFNKMYFVEALFWLFVSGLFIFYRYIIETTSQPIEALQAAGTAEVDALVSSMNVFISSFALATIALILLLLIAFCLSRAIVWTDLLEKKFTRKKYLKFILLKFIWTLIWTPLIALLLIPVFLLSGTAYLSANIFATFQLFIFANIALYFIIAYFGLFLYHAYFMHHKLYESITQAFKHGTLKLPKMFITIIFLVIGLIIIAVFMTLLKSIGLSYWITDLVIVLYLLLALRRYMIMKVALLHLDHI